MTLFALLNSYHQELEADFEDHGWDLLDFWRGTVTIRKTWIRIRLLLNTQTSQFLRAFSPKDARWPELNWMIADLIDITQRAHFQKPSRYPRPGDKERVDEARAKSRARFDARQKQRGT